MLKFKQTLHRRVARGLIGVVLGSAIAASASAGTIYSWRTLDGSQAFTDDVKRIPVRYRDSAERQTLGRLEEYPRYTPSQVAAGGTYRERLEQRLEHLRRVAATPAADAAAPESRAGAPEGLRLGVPLGSARDGASEHISLPIAAAREAGEVIVSESVRLVRDPGHITTRHATKVLQGDRLIAIRKAERNDTAPREWEADPVPLPLP